MAETFGRIIWLTIVVCCLAVQPAKSAKLSSTVAVVKKSIVGIGTFEAIRRPPVEIMGTGFVIHDGLHVITNYHVLSKRMEGSDLEKLVVITGRGAKYSDRDAEVVALDPVHDLALLKMKGDPLPALKLGGGSLLPEGSYIAVTGFPIGNILGVYPVTHQGIIAAITPVRIPQIDSRLLNSNMIMRKPFDVYQLDLTAFPGNSGSPLYDVATGQVEAILNSTFVKETKERALAEPTGISFAIPVIYVHMLMKKSGLVQ